MRPPMTTKITHLSVRDIRFPTSRSLDGSDAMNAAPDYSATYVTVHTNPGGLEGHGLTFTIGRGNEICVAAVKSLAPMVVGLTLEESSAHARDLLSVVGSPKRSLFKQQFDRGPRC